MKKALIPLIFFLASCAGVSNYPLNLSYSPVKEYEKSGAGTISVAIINDRRAIADKRQIGARDNRVPFISLIDEPSDAVARAFRIYLEKRGYSVKRLNESWDGAAETIKPSWGDMLIGGSLEDFTISVKSSSPVKTEYACSIKLNLIFADVASKKIRHQERFDISTTYTTVAFSRSSAERLINKAMSEAVESALAGVSGYFKKE